MDRRDVQAMLLGHLVIINNRKDPVNLKEIDMFVDIIQSYVEKYFEQLKPFLEELSAARNSLISIVKDVTNKKLAWSLFTHYKIQDAYNKAMNCLKEYK